MATDVQFSYISGNTMVLTLSGLGFIEGSATEYRIGTETVVDTAANTGPDVYQSGPTYYANSGVQVQVNLVDGAFGPVTVKTAGGASAAFSIDVTGISGKAMSGTPADAGIASANPGQAVTILGTA